MEPLASPPGTVPGPVTRLPPAPPPPAPAPAPPPPPATVPVVRKGVCSERVDDAGLGRSHAPRLVSLKGLTWGVYKESAPSSEAPTTAAPVAPIASAIQSPEHARQSEPIRRRRILALLPPRSEFGETMISRQMAPSGGAPWEDAATAAAVAVMNTDEITGLADGTGGRMAEGPWRRLR